jgi:hypothetical protein
MMDKRTSLLSLLFGVAGLLLCSVHYSSMTGSTVVEGTYRSFQLGLWRFQLVSSLHPWHRLLFVSHYRL